MTTSINVPCSAAQAWRYIKQIEHLDGSLPLLLKHFDQLSFSEIGGLLDVATTTVKTHYYRGIDKLRSVFQSEARAPEGTKP